jgi:hypothetical protein
VAQDQHLAGKRLRFRIALDSTATELDGQPCFDCRSRYDYVSAGVRFCSTEQIAEDTVDLVVDGTVHVRRLGPWQTVPCFWQVELWDAVVVRT